MRLVHNGSILGTPQPLKVRYPLGTLTSVFHQVCLYVLLGYKSHPSAFHESSVCRVALRASSKRRDPTTTEMAGEI